MARDTHKGSQKRNTSWIRGPITRCAILGVPWPEVREGRNVHRSLPVPVQAADCGKHAENHGNAGNPRLRRPGPGELVHLGTARHDGHGDCLEAGAPALLKTHRMPIVEDPWKAGRGPAVDEPFRGARFPASPPNSLTDTLPVPGSSATVGHARRSKPHRGFGHGRTCDAEPRARDAALTLRRAASHAMHGSGTAARTTPRACGPGGHRGTRTDCARPEPGSPPRPSGSNCATWPAQ